jgi:hypothetical protein
MGLNQPEVQELKNFRTGSADFVRSMVESIHHLPSIQAVDLYSIGGLCILQPRQLLAPEFWPGLPPNFSRPA